MRGKEEERREKGSKLEVFPLLTLSLILILLQRSRRLCYDVLSKVAMSEASIASFISRPAGMATLSLGRECVLFCLSDRVSPLW